MCLADITTANKVYAVYGNRGGLTDIELSIVTDTFNINSVIVFCILTH